jgi:Flp pilus assembly protein TadG
MIEFILGLMIVISFFFFYVRMSAVFAVGNYIHYATFMAARAYASGTTTRDNQVSNANNVLQASLGGRFKSLIKASGGDGTSITGATIGPGPYFADPANQDAWNQGVTLANKVI